MKRAAACCCCCVASHVPSSLPRDPLETLPETETVGEPTATDEVVDVLAMVLCGSAPNLRPGSTVLHPRGELLLGRGGACVITGVTSSRRWAIPDPHVSDPHCRLSFVQGGINVEDLDSRNGTFVNGAPVKQRPLGDGDVITVGRTAFVLRRERSRVMAAVPTEAELPQALQTRAPLLGIAFRRLTQIAKTTLPVFFAGETGTGKEVSARALHQLSGRAGAFVAINCGALPEHLVESELFGYKRGAFSGALADRKGLVRAAHGGTLFLDEIGDLPADAQVKLLRVLQERVVVPLGSSEPEPVDFRLVTATHRDLPALVAEGAFRSDLWARLRGFEVQLPSLKDRREDLGMLVAQLLRRHGGPSADAFRLDRRAVDLLTAHTWPLNIRELERVLEVAVTLAGTDHEIRGDVIEPLLATPATKPTPKAKLSEGQLRTELERMLAAHAGNVAAVSREMGHTRMQIHRWMKRFGLSPDGFRKRDGLAPRK